MTVTIRKPTDAPIVEFTLEGSPDLDGIADLQAQVETWLSQLGRFDAIIDVRGSEITYGEVIALFESVFQMSVFTHPQIHAVFVGESVPQDHTNQTHLPVFADKSAAYAYFANRSG
ncbi:MAG: hypothetical protein MUF87_16080 [Anaerolineae bacterium]|nr:hypothetical protein [Anaerolineae bacterium]